MAAQFDTEREDAELKSAREREEEDVAKILSGKYGLAYADLSLTAVDTEALRLIPQAKAEAARAAAFALTGKTISLALENPNNPAAATLGEELAGRGYQVRRFLVSKKSLEKALSRYADLSYAVEARPGVFTIGNARAARASLVSLAALKSALAAAESGHALERTSTLLEDVIEGALALSASDIHFEPEDGGKVRLRYRLDGLLTDVFFFDAAAYHQLNSRIKLLAGIKLNVTDRAQDGRFSIDEGSGQIDTRVSFIPGAYGESIVMRLLDPATTQHSFKELGINAKLLKRLDAEIRRANGMLLTTGPTGSGKTTSLYAFLREISTPDLKIITIEDPIEYHLNGIVQTQVEEKKYTFAEGLRSIVRQDPDVIMVGEIRDGETAEIAIQAALTGHFVFSTLHTNNAAGTFPRLVDLGADPKTFASAISVSMAQRLVRTLNPAEKKERPATAQEQKIIKAVLDTIVDRTLVPEKFDTLFAPAPASPDSTGYKGRIGLYEAIFMDDELGNFLRDNPPENEIAKLAAKQGYLTMLQDGILKVLAGQTTLDELGRAVDLPQI
ncbi:MAG TPA: ATPase, T2SS/T4P/T4SS family [Candidatus Paceibacterota bacterium]|nr:ATPase, T2SS/T4P/T4SS family [Candidatus Paceibacterota bacterium]